MKAERLELDFVAAPRRAAWPGVLLLVAALLVAGELWQRYRELRLESERLATAHGLVATPRGAARPLPRERLDEEAKSAEAVARQLALPWARLVETLESAATPEVAVLVLQPDAQSRALRLVAEARHRGAMFDYLKRLSEAPALAEVHIVSHQVRMDEPQRPIQFAVQAALRVQP